MNLRDAAQQALRELKFYIGCYGTSKSASEAVDNLDAALALEENERDWSLLEATQESLREHMAEIQTLRAALAQQPAQVPLTEAQCVDIYLKAFIAHDDPLGKHNMTVAFARAIEAAHGIKEQTDGQS